jgi:23S rRNA (adenine2503-C2)-methyltransferase
MMNIAGLSKSVLQKLVVETMQMKPYRGAQIYHEMMVRGERDFGRMSTIKKSARSTLASKFHIDWGLAIAQFDSNEAVAIAEQSRSSLEKNRSSLEKNHERIDLIDSNSRTEVEQQVISESRTEVENDNQKEIENRKEIKSDNGKEEPSAIVDEFELGEERRDPFDESENESGLGEPLTTKKWLVECDDKRLVETVFIPATDRGTLCVSSQIGCTLSCRFCCTGTQPIVRNLEAREIVGQVMLAAAALGDFPKQPHRRSVTNLVFMGTGEPFYNYRNVSGALEMLTARDGLAFGKRKIVVSTSGVAPRIERFAVDWPGVSLAVSLHACTDRLRSSLMDINERWDLATLRSSLLAYTAAPRTGRITFEYVLIDGVNDSLADAERVLEWCRPFNSVVNLIPFNHFRGAPFERPSPPSTIARFAAHLEAGGRSAPVRWPRGRDIDAACGQLLNNDRKQESCM